MLKSGTILEIKSNIKDMTVTGEMVQYFEILDHFEDKINDGEYFICMYSINGENLGDTYFSSYSIHIDLANKHLEIISDLKAKLIGIKE